MAKFGRMFLITLLLFGLLLSTAAVVTGCGEETTTDTGAATATTAKDKSTILGDRALEVFASTPPGGVDYGNNTINAAKLSAKLADPAEKAKLFLLDVRGKADFDAAHIEGSTQVEFKSWAAPENLAKYPKDKKIVVVCYTGNTAAQAAMGLRMLGYDAAVLKAGINGWAANQGQAGVAEELANTNYPVVTTPSTATAPAPPTTTFDKPSDSDYEVLADEAATMMSEMQGVATIKAEDLSAKLNNPAEKEDIFLLDIRQEADFNTGHIDGATRVDFLAVAVPDNLKLLPKDKQVVVICYTGNTAAQANTVLRMLGYDAVVLKYGMMGWNGDGKDAYLQEINSANYPVVSS